MTGRIIPHILDDPVNDCGDSMWQLTVRQQAAVQSNSSLTTACYQPPPADMWAMFGEIQKHRCQFVIGIGKEKDPTFR